MQCRRSLVVHIISIVGLFLLSFQVSYWYRLGRGSMRAGDDGRTLRRAHSEGMSDSLRIPAGDEDVGMYARQLSDPTLLWSTSVPRAVAATPPMMNTPSVTDMPRLGLRDILRRYDDLTPAQKARLDEGTSSKCITKGMQTKCYFSNFMVQRNRFHIAGALPPQVPNPIYPPDGQKGPLVQYHKYRGHPITALGGDKGMSPHCDAFVTRPTVFLYRMSGHSTYHLWENNLGPFFATLNDDFGLPRDAMLALRGQLLDPKQLVVAYVDNKPSHGPKAPHLLSKLLRLFTNVDLVNATALEQRVCFTDAVVGISSSSFPHRGLLYRMMDSVAGYSPPAPLPLFPNVLFISRNHKSVIRGRKIANEADVLEAVNRTLLAAYDAAVVGATDPPPYSFHKVHMEDYTFEEQIRMAMRTHIILSPHGGGVTNCIWMREGSITVEFVAPVGKTLTGMYHTLCGKSGVTHFHFLADPDPADEGVDMKGNARLFSNMVIPPERIVDNVKKALGLYAQNVAAKRRG